ncbi:hypothetical protein I317_00845 [Kwoniella heveanensis CBS 569]|nr:hypothetical protein I317_00845 [Kwoniella heveanensis CBS 569]
MRWFSTFLPPSTKAGGASPNETSLSSENKVDPNVPRPTSTSLPGSAGGWTEDSREGEWGDDAIGRWKWRSKVWTKRWDAAPVPEEYEAPSGASTSGRNRNDHCHSSTPRLGDPYSGESGAGADSRSTPMFFSRRLGRKGPIEPELNQKEDRVQDPVIPAAANHGEAELEGSSTLKNDNGNRTVNRTRNLAVLETMLRSSYRAGFNDALKLSPFMPVLPSSNNSLSPSSSPLSYGTDTDSNKQIVPSSPLTLGDTDHPRSLSWSEGVTPAVGFAGFLLGTSALLLYVVSAGTRQVRDVERGLKEVLALVQLRERSDAASVSKVGNELRALKSMIESARVAGKDKGVTATKSAGNAASGSGADSGISTPGPGGMIKVLSEPRSAPKGDAGERAVDRAVPSTSSVESPLSEVPLTRTPSPSSPSPSSSLLTPSSSNDSSLAPRLNLINQQLATMVSQFVKYKQSISDLNDTVDSIERKIVGMGGDISDIRERLKSFVTTLSRTPNTRYDVSPSDAERRTGISTSSASRGIANSHSDPWSKWYQTADPSLVPKQPMAASQNEVADQVVPASGTSSPPGQLAPSVLGLRPGQGLTLGQNGQLPSLQSHGHNDIMPLHDIRKAIEGVKQGYLADQADKSAEKSPSRVDQIVTSPASLPSPPPSSASASGSPPRPTDVSNFEANVQTPPVPVEQSTSTPIEGKHLVHSFPRDHLLIQPYPPHDRAEDIERAAKHSTDIARVKYPARADLLGVAKQEQQIQQEWTAQDDQVGRASLAKDHCTSESSQIEKGTPDGRPILLASPPSREAHQPLQSPSQNPALDRNDQGPTGTTAAPNPAGATQQESRPENRSTSSSSSSSSPTTSDSTSGSSTTYTETPTGHWWTFHHSSPSNAWRIRGFGWYDSVSGTPRDASGGNGGVSVDQPSASKTSTERVPSGTSRPGSNARSNSTDSGPRTKRQSRGAKQADQEDRSVAGWAIERARKRWGDWPFY